MKDGRLIPNTFQHPNAYIDWLAYYLTPEEEKVLNKAIREILGWSGRIESRQARIALSVFEFGKTSRETGDQLCLGCGLSRKTIIKALVGLDKYKILVKVGEPTNDGQMYTIQDNYQLVDLAGLKARREEKDAENARRTKRARSAPRTGSAVRHTAGGVCDTPQVVLSDTPKETKRKPKKETKIHTSFDVALPDGLTQKEVSNLMDFHQCDEQTAIAHWCRLNKAKPVKTPKKGKADPVLDIVTQAARRDNPLWFLEPGQPAGDHEYRGPMLAFCAVIDREPSTLGQEKALQWERQFEKIATVATGADPILIAPGVMAEAIKAIRGDWNFEHNRWTSPFCQGFADLVEHTSAQIEVGKAEQSSTSALEKAGYDVEGIKAWAQQHQ